MSPVCKHVDLNRTLRSYWSIVALCDMYCSQTALAFREYWDERYLMYV